MRTITCEDVSAKGLAERYAAMRLRGDEAAGFEEHLLGCERCQQELRFVAATRKVLREHRPGIRRRWQLAAAAASLLAAAGILIAVRARVEAPLEMRRLGAVSQPPLYLGETVRAAASGDSLFAAAMQAYDSHDWDAALRGLVRARAAGAATLPAEFFGAAASLMAGQDSAAAAGFERVLRDGDTPYAAEAHYYRAKALLRLDRAADARVELALIAPTSDPLGARSQALLDTLDAVAGSAASAPPRR